VGPFVVVVNEGDGVDDQPRLILPRVQPLYRGVHVLSRLILGRERALRRVEVRWTLCPLPECEASPFICLAPPSKTGLKPSFRGDHSRSASAQPRERQNLRIGEAINNPSTFGRWFHKSTTVGTISQPITG
jgi:hypothetical protein